MNEEKINDGIKELANIGLNIFSSTLVKNLPNDILDHFNKEKIPYNDDDTLCLIAHGGQTLWRNLNHLVSKNESANKTHHPIDEFSTAQMNWFAKQILEDDIQILFPHNSWNIPLQRIGRFMNLSRPSLLGLDINRDYGVWFAFRGAFLTKKKIPEHINENFSSPCETCEGKPCQSSCPAKAIEGMQKFNVSLCADYRLKINSNCSDRCLARLACPYKNQHQYEIEQIRYHMSIVDNFLACSKISV